MTTHSSQMVDVDNHEINPEQALHTFALVAIKTANDNEDEYIGHHLHFHVPPQATQPTVQKLNQGLQIPPPYPRAYSAVAPPLIYNGAPYALCGGQYGQTVGQIVNL